MRSGKIGLPAKKSNVLWVAVLEDLEIALVEIGNEAAMAVGHGDHKMDQSGCNADGGKLFLIWRRFRVISRLAVACATGAADGAEVCERTEAGRAASRSRSAKQRRRAFIGAIIGILSSFESIKFASVFAALPSVFR